MVQMHVFSWLPNRRHTAGLRPLPKACPQKLMLEAGGQAAPIHGSEAGPQKLMLDSQGFQFEAV
jgi:hypothetical protein